MLTILPPFPASTILIAARWAHRNAPERFGVYNLLPLLVRELQELAGRVASSGVVDQYVDAAQGVDQLVDHSCGLRQLREVQPPHLAPAARPHGLERLLCPCFVGTVGDAYIEAVLRQFLRRLLPDPRV
jgi:hypothetical protein